MSDDFRGAGNDFRGFSGYRPPNSRNNFVRLLPGRISRPRVRSEKDIQKTWIRHSALPYSLKSGRKTVIDFVRLKEETNNEENPRRQEK